MTSKKFIFELAKFAPDIQKMKAKGYPEGAIKAELGGFILKENEGIKKIQENPLLDLLNRFDCSMFILGDITFQNCIRSDQNKKFYFAGLEGNRARR